MIAYSMHTKEFRVDGIVMTVDEIVRTVPAEDLVVETVDVDVTRG